MNANRTEGLSAVLAHFVAHACLKDVGVRARDMSARILTDTLGVMIAGTTSEIAPVLWRYLDLDRETGHPLIFEPFYETGPETAAWTYASLGAAIDFDDVLSMMPGHPSAIILGALLAMADTHCISGPRLIDAHIVGLEVGARIGAGLGLGHYNQGFHATGTVGIFSALAALGRVLVLDTTTLESAFGIACSMASGLNRNFGTMTKAMHSGWAARSAMTAICLARAGLTASALALEGAAGFFPAFGTPESSASRTMQGLEGPWVINEPGVSLRKFACYNANQRPMQALLDLKAQMKFEVGEIERIECLMPPGAMQGSIYCAPVTGLEAKFSLHYVLAAGALDGRYGLSTFSDEAVSRSDIAHMLERVTAREDPSCRGSHPDFERQTPGTRGFVQLTITLKDGRQQSVQMHASPGHPSIGLTWLEIEEKFMDCAMTAGLDNAYAQTIFSAMSHLDDCQDITSIYRRAYSI